MFKCLIKEYRRQEAGRTIEAIVGAQWLSEQKSADGITKPLCTLKIMQRGLLCNRVLCYFFLPKSLLRNSTTFSTAKATVTIPSVSTGALGAKVASSIMGKPSTMAGKF